MKTVVDILEERISAAMAAVGSVGSPQVSGQSGFPAIVRPAADAQFGDYQVNGVMALAKKMKTNPKQLAEKVLEKIDVADICEKPEVAGPGFINLKLKPDFVAQNLLQINIDNKRLGIEKTDRPQTVVVDFSCPNVAKQMHVGHLRSTIIGDCICRLLEFEGHKVIRQNHIGDWGTALGMVILGLWHMCMAEKRGGKPYYENDIEDLKVYANNKQELKNICNRIRIRHEEDWEEDFIEWRGDGKKRFKPFLDNLKTREDSAIWEKITILYQYVNLLEESLVGLGLTTITRVKKKSYKKDENPFEYISIPYESLSRHITAMMQNIDDKDNEQEKDAWERIRKISLKYFHEIYRILNVKLSMEDVRGESDYRKNLSSTVNDLLRHNTAVKSNEAICIFPDGFKTKEGKPLPFIIQKSDGAYLYATTDLAALRYRVKELKADKIIYVTDARQKQHFEMLFKVAKMAGWLKDGQVFHVMFGSVLGDDGKPLKTRSGENVKLKELLDEAVERAKAVVEQKNSDLPDEEKKEIAKAVGIGAVKYADFSNNRTSDYVFSFDKMLAMEGNTAPYMQYAYARIKSIERKAISKEVDVEKELSKIKSLDLAERAELDLAKQLVRYGEAVESAADDYRPNYLTSYLYELAQKFSTFYTTCPVLDAAPAKRPTRLLLCDLTARTIEHGLRKLLGIEVPKQM
jgi:arginyl-tRNA synthetase